MHTFPNPHNPIQSAASDSPAPTVDTTQSAAPQQPTQSPLSTTTPQSIPLPSIFLALTTFWAIGGSLRFLAVCLESPSLSRASAILLFAPFPIVPLWLAWRTQLRRLEIVTAALLAIAVFAFWNAVMLFEIPTAYRAYTLLGNALHWAAFAVLAIAAGKCWQWLTGVGIWRRTPEAASTPAEPPTSRFSLRHLLIITVVFAVAIAAYQSWIRSVIGSQPSIAIWQSDLDQILTPEPPTWYQWFPENSRLWVSGALGGCLLPLHAFVLASILRMRQRRGIAIVAWIIAATAIRLLTDQIYWHSDRLRLAGSELTWIQINYGNSVPGRIGIPRRYASYIEPFNDLAVADSTTASAAAQWTLKRMFEAGGLAAKLPAKALDACIQTAALAASLVWLARRGFRIGTRAIRERSPPQDSQGREPMGLNPSGNANSL